MGAARSQIAGVLPREPHIQGKGSWLFARSLLEDLSQSTSATPIKLPLLVLGSGHLLFPEVTETPHHYLVFGQTTVRLCGWGGMGWGGPVCSGTFSWHAHVELQQVLS